MPINSKTTAKLSSGFKIPAIGFGTFFPEPVDQVAVEKAVKNALQLGYRHIDGAAVYQVEAAVGRGIKASGVSREEIFITSKLWNTEHDPKDVGPALDKTLKDLDVDYVDLYLMHWPKSWVKQDPFVFFPEDKHGNPITNDIPIALTWAAMEALVATGKARSIGVSNFNQEKLEDLLKTAKIPPAVDQLYLHPYRQQKDLLEFCQSKNIHITAWGPLTINWAKKTNVTKDITLAKIAESINITPVQLALSWAVQRGTSVIPKSSSEERLRSNLEIVELPKEVFEQVEKLELLE